MNSKRQREVVRLLKRPAHGQQETTVLVFGSGLHKHLMAEDTATRGCGLSSPLTEWSALIKEVAKEEHLYHANHRDPAADWESLVIELATRELIQAAQAETRLSRIARGLLRESYYGDKTLRHVGTAILARYRHIISLNIDNTLANALRATGAQATKNGGLVTRRGKTWIQMHETLANESGAATSVWYPHGCIEGSHEFVLGTRQYGNVISELEAEFKSYKNRLRSTKLPPHEAYAEESWHAIRLHTIEDAQHLSWVRLMMVCDLVFIGAGLDRAETDLWWVLHQRQRNLARAPESIRPRTFLMTTRESLMKSPHLHSEPAGVLPVCYQEWDKVWSLIFGGRRAEPGD